MALELTTDHLITLVPLADVRPELVALLLPYCRDHHLSPDSSLEVNYQTTAVYLLSGGVDIDTAEGRQSNFAVSADSRMPLGQSHSGSATMSTETSARIVTIDRRRLDTVLTWSNLYEDGERPDTWLVPVLQSEVLARLPAANVHVLLRDASAHSYLAGERIITQGDPGETYYLVVSGSCTVLRESSAGLALMIATLECGDSFGEEALLTGEPRNASVETGDEGATVLAISEADFHTQMDAPLTRTLDYAQLVDPEDSGYTIIDVRSAEEFELDGLPGARNIALADLRDHRRELPKGAAYLVYCDTGRRAIAAAFQLTEVGLDVRSLNGDRTQAFAGAPDTQARLDAARDRYEQALKTTAHLSTMPESEQTDPDLRTRIAEAQDGLSEAKNQRLELEHQLRREHAETARVEAELRVLRDKLRAETEARLRTEQEHLQTLYESAEQRVQTLGQSLQRLTQTAEHARQQIDAEIATARAQVDEQVASTMDTYQCEASASEQRATEIRELQSRREIELIEASERQLSEERQRLEAAVAQSVTELRTAEQRLAAAESERAERKHQAAQREQRQRAREAGARAHIEEQLSSPEGPQATMNDAVKSAVAEETLRLQLQEEVEVLLRNEADDVNAQAVSATRQLNEIARQRAAAEAREALEHEAEVNLFSEVDAQLSEPDHDSTAAGEAAYLRVRSEELQHALNSNLEESRATRDALDRARKHLQKLRQDSGV